MPPASNIICLLDDEPSVLKALGRLLASEGLHAEKFSEPARFLDYARNHPVKLAVIDIRMPGMTGLEVMAKLRVVSPDARVIIMTGESNPVHQSTAMARGARAFFLKPFDDETFLAAVRDALSNPG
ncbi:MAG TPA: response regulator [Chthoniobacterales bacterium]